MYLMCMVIFVISVTKIKTAFETFHNQTRELPFQLRYLGVLKINKILMYFCEKKTNINVRFYDLF